MRCNMATFDLPHKYALPSPPPRSKWEQLLASIGINEKDCTSSLIKRTRKGQAIRLWTLSHYSTSYVPEWILQMLGLQQRLNKTWQDLD